jgi:hypothetical protein
MSHCCFSEKIDTAKKCRKCGNREHIARNCDRCMRCLGWLDNAYQMIAKSVLFDRHVDHATIEWQRKIILRKCTPTLSQLMWWWNVNSRLFNCLIDIFYSWQTKSFIVIVLCRWCYLSLLNRMLCCNLPGNTTSGINRASGFVWVPDGCSQHRHHWRNVLLLVSHMKLTTIL